MSKPDMEPFANDSDALIIAGDFNVENGTDKISMFGSIDITRDKRGLVIARQLKDVLDRITEVLESDPSLTDRVVQAGEVVEKDNPWDVGEVS